MEQNVATIHRPIPTWPVRPEIATSIIALGYTLSSAALDIYDIPGTRKNWRDWAPSSLLRKRLEEKWCPARVAVMMTDFDIDGHYYMAELADPPKEDRATHLSCTESACLASVNESSYITKHSPDCGDGNVDECRKKDIYESGYLDEHICDASEEPPKNFQEVVRGIIANNGTPIIFWNELNNKIKVLEYNADKDLKPNYVALSHV